jgi:hypothetical protein
VRKKITALVGGGVVAALMAVFSVTAVFAQTPPATPAPTTPAPSAPSQTPPGAPAPGAPAQPKECDRDGDGSADSTSTRFSRNRSAGGKF